MKNISAKKILKTLTPPIFWDTARSLWRREPKQYRGDYKTWGEAKALTTGYDLPLILDKVQKAALRVKKGESAYERDSVNFDQIQHSWALLAGLLWISGSNGNRLSVLDFGGSLGSSYYQNRKFLSHLSSLSWSVVEQKHFAEFGNHNLTDEHLKFYDDLKECFEKEKPDVILLSSVLPYVEKPYEIMGAIKKMNPHFIIIDRTPFLSSDALPDRITVQQSSKKIYEASYPAWFFNQKKFTGFLTSDYEIIAEWKALAGTISLGDDEAEDKGFIFRKK